MNTKEIKNIFNESTVDSNNVVEQMTTAEELAKNKEITKEILKYGSVLVYYVPKKSMLKKPAEPGLIQLIGNATTTKEVTNFLKNGKDKYKNATNGTIRKWEKAADKRIAELNSKK